MRFKKKKTEVDILIFSPFIPGLCAHFSNLSFIHLPTSSLNILGPHPHPTRNRQSSGGGGGAGINATHRLKQNKAAHVRPRAGKDTPRQGDESRAGCERSLSLQENIPGPSLLLSRYTSCTQPPFPKREESKDSPQAFGLSSWVDGGCDY